VQGKEGAAAGEGVAGGGQQPAIALSDLRAESGETGGRRRTRGRR